MGLTALTACASGAEERGPDLRADGLPGFASVEEAIAFVVVPGNVNKFKGTNGGSEFYVIELPTGEKATNWRIDSYFRSVFRAFGESAYPRLADLLNHEHEFVRVGAYAVLNSYMHARGIRYNPLDFNPRPQKESDRIKAIAQLKATLEDGGEEGGHR